MAPWWPGVGGERACGAVMDDMGIVRYRRWLAWGFHHGVRVRPAWLANAIVAAWNAVSCRLWGHEWFPEFDCSGDEPVASEIEEFCPNCCATRTVRP